MSERMLLLVILFLSAFGFSAAGAFAYEYWETRYTLWVIPYTAYPYRDFAAPLFGIGILIFAAFIIAAIGFLAQKPKKPPAPTF